jgi:hypothetical protein
VLDHPCRPELRQSVIALVGHSREERLGVLLDRRVQRRRINQPAGRGGSEEIDPVVQRRQHTLPLGSAQGDLAGKPLGQQLPEVFRVPPDEIAVLRDPPVQRRLHDEGIDVDVVVGGPALELVQQIGGFESAMPVEVVARRHGVMMADGGSRPILASTGSAVVPVIVGRSDWEVWNCRCSGSIPTARR